MRKLLTGVLSALVLVIGAAAPAIASARTFSVNGAFVGPAYSHHGSKWKLESHGAVVGSATVHCKATASCSVIFRFRNGSLQARVAINPRTRTDRGSITGGTRSYRHAHGSFTLHFVNAFSTVFTFHL